MPAPIDPEKVELLEAYAGFMRAGVKPTWDWEGFSEYLDALKV